MTDPIEIMARAIGPFTADDQPDEPHLYVARSIVTCLARAGFAIVPTRPNKAILNAMDSADPRDRWQDIDHEKYAFAIKAGSVKA